MLKNLELLHDETDLVINGYNPLKTLWFGYTYFPYTQAGVYSKLVLNKQKKTPQKDRSSQNLLFLEM